MDNSEQIKNLVERMECLEQKLASISLNAAKEVIFTNCPIGDIAVGDGCKLDLQNCTIGAVVDENIDDADSCLDDLECRLDEINERIDEAEIKLEKNDTI